MKSYPLKTDGKRFDVQPYYPRPWDVWTFPDSEKPDNTYLVMYQHWSVTANGEIDKKFVFCVRVDYDAGTNSIKFYDDSAMLMAKDFDVEFIAKNGKLLGDIQDKDQTSAARVLVTYAKDRLS